VVITAYGIVLGALYACQRNLVFDVRPRYVTPTEAGFPEAQENILTTDDGERIVTWLRRPVDPLGPLFLLLLGKGDNLGSTTALLRELTHDGSGVLAIAYRGYSGSTGSPSEDGFKRDAEAAYRFALGLVPSSRVVLIGYSVGTGVAVPLAADHRAAALILLAPFTSAAAIGAAELPFIPVRLLMKDQFRSIDAIGNVRMPILILHGARDQAIPIGYGRELYAAAPEPKRFVALPQADHDPLAILSHGGREAIGNFLSEVLSP
jgi:fermentation-respiration switch protein FrsA (DUF1100 family)